MFDRERIRVYTPLLGFLAILIITYFTVLPPELVRTNCAALTLAFLFGGLVGVAEIASRYRDEPFQAIWSPYGLIYVILNGVISALALLLIFRYKQHFPPAIAEDPLLAAITAGFGSGAVMRTRLAVLKGPDNKEVSVGPDYVITTLLQIFDRNIDRLRATKRQQLAIENLAEMRRLGNFTNGSRYLLVSLLAFQNLSEDTKKQLSAIISEYESQQLPDEIKYLALEFVFLTIAGESHFKSVLDQALRTLPKAGQGNPTNP